MFLVLGAGGVTRLAQPDSVYKGQRGSGADRYGHCLVVADMSSLNCLDECRSSALEVLYLEFDLVAVVCGILDPALSFGFAGIHS